MATFQTITPEILAWIADQARAGYPREAVIEAMGESGWAPAVARRAVAEALSRPPAHEQPVPEAVPVPWIQIEDGRHVLHAGDHPMQVVAVGRLPRLAVIAGFLSDAECDALVEQARPRLEPSTTVDHWDAGNLTSDARTSDGMFFALGETPLVEALEQRIAEVFHWPVERGEGLQVLRYRAGNEFKPHHDYFDPWLPNAHRLLERGGQRVATLLLYLRTPERGGSTLFPDAGMAVAPLKGQAVLFCYDRPDAATLTLHAGAPVVEGEKWVATKWLRERAFA